MRRVTAVKMAVLMFTVMVVFVTFQAYWIAQLDIPYLLRSLLAISGGMFMGYAVSFLCILWLRGDNSFQ
jgi:hypothetical protein